MKSNLSFLVATVLLPPLLNAAPLDPRDCATRLTQLLEKKPELKTGYLFSALRIKEDSALTKRYVNAQYRIANLTHVDTVHLPDLHVTLVYVGKWDVSKYSQMAKLMLPVFANLRVASQKVVRMGKQKQVVALELHFEDASVREQMIKVKQKMLELGLKAPDTFDNEFRAHITLAKANAKDITEFEEEDLMQAQDYCWDEGLERVDIDLARDAEATILLAGAARTQQRPEYVTIEEFLEQNER